MCLLLKVFIESEALEASSNNFEFILESQSNVQWPCDVDTDCDIIISGATCALPLGYCQCPAGYTFNAGVTKCIKGKLIVVAVNCNGINLISNKILKFIELCFLESLYGENCEEGIQCSHML